MQASIGSLTNKKMQSRAKQRVQQLNEVEADVMDDLLKIKDQIETVRTKVSENLNSPNNFNGCLLGDCDGFVQAFDAQIEAFKEKIAENRKHWERQS